MSDKPVAVNCEAPYEGCLRVQLLFPNKRAIDLHMGEYCNRDYKRCEIYLMTMKAKYED